MRVKKSDPRIGRATSASLKECVSDTAPNLSLTGAEPNEGITEPFAAMSGEEESVFWSATEAGKTEKSAPVSTKKEDPDTSS